MKATRIQWKGKGPLRFFRPWLKWPVYSWLVKPSEPISSKLGGRSWILGVVSRLHGKSGRTSGGFFCQREGGWDGGWGLWLKFRKSCCLLVLLTLNVIAGGFLIFLSTLETKKMVEGLVGWFSLFVKGLLMEFSGFFFFRSVQCFCRALKLKKVR